jgi:hypothetical protein
VWSEAGTPLHTASAMPQFRSSKAMGDRWRERMTRTSVRAATKNPLPKNQPHSHYGASAERASPDPPILRSGPGFASGATVVEFPRYAEGSGSGMTSTGT